MSAHDHPAQIRKDGLVDGCERCCELAVDPFAGLDDENLKALVDRYEKASEPRSINEAIATQEVAKAIQKAVRLGQVGWRRWADPPRPLVRGRPQPRSSSGW